MDLNWILLDTVGRFPAKEALIWGDERFTFRQILSAARRVAGGLIARGVKLGDRVGIFLPNAPETIFAHLGIQLAGGIRVPVNPEDTIREAGHVLDTSECSLVITDPVRLPVAEGCAMEAAMRRPEERSTPSPYAATPRPLFAQPVLMSDLLSAEALQEELNFTPDRVSLLSFTSGTSGKPKGVRLSYSNLSHNIRGLVQVWEWTDADRLLLCLPSTHQQSVAQGLNGWIATGCTLLLQERFRASEALDAIERHGITLFFGIPAMYRELLNVPGFAQRDLATVRLWACGSAPLDPALEERFERATGKRLCNRYGLTETGLMTASAPGAGQRPGSVGRALPGVEIRIVDPSGREELSPRQTGEIVVRGPGVSPGYWNREVDAAMRMQNGFFRTGDLGWRDADGFHYISGRAKEVIISGGASVSPAEVEEVLLKHPGVSEAGVFGVADPALGEQVRAVIVPRPGVEVTAELLGSWCAAHMVAGKRPGEFRIVNDPLPRNAARQIDRAALKAVYGRKQDV